MKSHCPRRNRYRRRTAAERARTRRSEHPYRPRNAGVPGYTGEAKEAIPVIKVKAVTHRTQPIWRTTVGPCEEHVNMAGIPTEASILDMVERAMPGKLLNVFAHSAGGGKLLAVLQFKKSSPADEGRQRRAALPGVLRFPGAEARHFGG